MSYAVRFTADIIRPDGSDTDVYGEPCEEGHGYVVESGWYAPSWSRDTVSDNPDYAQVDRWSDDDSTDPVTWLADVLTERLGLVGSVGPFGTSIYAAESDTDPYTGVAVRVAAHPDGFTGDDVSAAIDVMRAREAVLFGRPMSNH
jgi:hypothetical protein